MNKPDRVTILDEFGKPAVIHKPKPAIQRANRNGVNLSARQWGADAFGYTYYSGAHPGIQRGVISWQLPQDFSTEAAFARQYLSYHARDLYRNCPEVRGIIEKIIGFVVGINMEAQSGSVKGKEIYNDYFKEWSKKATTNGATFGEVQRICLRWLIVDGDCGVLKKYHNGRPSLQLFPIQRIGNCGVRKVPENGHFDGVEYNIRTGEVIRYWLCQGGVATSWGSNQGSVAIPARPDQFALIYSNDYIDQYRGVSHLAASINDSIDFMNVMEALKKGMVFRELIAMIIKRQGGIIDPDEDQSAPLFGDEPPDIQRQGQNYGQDGYDSVLSYASLAQVDDLFKVMGPGNAPVLKPGEEIEFPSSHSPSREVLEAYDKMVGRLCQTLGVGYDLVIDPGKIHGTATRAVLRMSEESFKRYSMIMNCRLNHFVWDYVIEDGMLRGDIPMYEDWDCVKFRSPVAPSVDIAKDSKAALAELSAGVKNLSDIVGEQGKDFYEHVDKGIEEKDYQLQKAEEISKKYDMTLQEAIKFLYGTEVEDAEDSTIKQEDAAKAKAA